MRLPKKMDESPVGPGDPPSDLQLSAGSDASSEDLSDEVCRNPIRITNVVLPVVWRKMCQNLYRGTHLFVPVLFFSGPGGEMEGVVTLEVAVDPFSGCSDTLTH